MKKIFLSFLVSFLFQFTAYTQEGWFQQSPFPTGEMLTSVKFIELTGWAAGYNGTIIMTTDGGETWTKRESGVSSILNSIFFIHNMAATLMNNIP